MPSVSRKPGGHESMASVKSTPIASHNNRRILSGFSRTSRASITAGSLPCVRAPIEDFDLLDEPDVLQGGIVFLLNVRNDNLRRIADEEAIRYGVEPGAIDPRQKMMGHLFLVKDAFAVLNVAGQLCDHFPPIGFALLDDSSRPGCSRPVACR